MWLTTSQLDHFQEWPQLLDPILAELVHALVEAFLQFSVSYRHDYERFCINLPPAIEPLPRAICHLLYVFCKVRGYKVIVRLLNNEAKYIEPLLMSFRAWKGADGDAGCKMTWQERYIMLLWLSHLMLAPFELSSISTASDVSAALPQSLEDPKLALVARNLLSLALEHVFVPSKDREAACMLISKLALRGDMRQIDMPRRVLQWSLARLAEANLELDDRYDSIGCLTLVFGLMNSASHLEAISYNHQVFSACHNLAIDDGSHARQIREAAPARKLIIKILRTCIQHAVALEKANVIPAEQVDVMLEDGIQVLLEWLADTDIPVRQTAAKALAMITLVMEPQMSADIIEAVLASLDENMLLEDRSTGQIFPATDITKDEGMRYRKNISAVNALRWQGAMLTLGHLLFRRSPPVTLLPSIIEALLIGLRFEQRSSVGTSLGVGVRDAACFGIWSLARKYTTLELNNVRISAEAASAPLRTFESEISTLQIIATELVVSACLDPSGNLRRGASAALQELIGRHPDMVLAGISVVQTVDYHAVARRSRALVEVSFAASKLNIIYHLSLLHALLDWRALRATEAESRSQTGLAIGNLFGALSNADKLSFCDEIVAQIRNLKLNNVGSNAATRHGLFCALASIVSACNTQLDSNAVNVLKPPILDLNVAIGSIEGRATKDLVKVLEAAANVIEAVALCPLISSLGPTMNLWPQEVLPLLHRCTTASEEDILCSVAGKANVAVYNLLSEGPQENLLKDWIGPVPPKRNETVSNGRLFSLGLLFASHHKMKTAHIWRQRIVQFLSGVVESDLPIETRVGAMKGIVAVLTHSDDINHADLEILRTSIIIGLDDYTTDQRGDVGSWLRLESLQAAQNMASSQTGQEQRPLSAGLVQLAADKMTKVRFEAWGLLETQWTKLSSGQLHLVCQHQTDSTSFGYYRQITELFLVPWLSDALLRGMIGSIAGTNDDISRNAAEALAAFLAIQTTKGNFAQVVDICCSLFVRLSSIASYDDKDVIPALDLTSFMLNQWELVLSKSKTPSVETCSALLTALTAGTASIQRVEATVRFAGAMSNLSHLRHSGLDQVTRKLLHKWPKIRNTAADMISVSCFADEYSRVDWNAPAISNKGQVVAMRKMLGVGGKTNA